MKITNTAIIILGASGDLAKKKLFPSLNNLVKRKHLDLKTCVVVGNGRKALNQEEFRLRSGSSENPEQTDAYSYYRGVTGLWSYVKDLEKRIPGGFDNHIVFFSLPASAFIDRCAQLLDDGFPSEETRVVIEKPFGYNSATAKQLNKDLLKHFPANQIYLIDHYLGKETLQNIMAIRFANQLFTPIWNRDHIHAVEVNGFETIGVEGRGSIYEEMGAMRDVVQNHLLQLLSLTMMEKPESLQADDIRVAKHNLLKAMHSVRTYRFQYEGYRLEENVAWDSQTETYVELELAVDNERWQGVPIYVRGGKKLHRAGVEIILHLKSDSNSLYPNDRELIIIKVQPVPGIEIWQKAKKPGLIDSQHFPLQDFSLNYNLRYRQDSSRDGVEAYTQLFYSVLCGDKSLFVHIDEAVTAWEIVEDMLGQGEVLFYPQNTIPKGGLPQWQGEYAKSKH
ncbi:glucose-6-phosphate dehydrogenase [Candidatus Haliotispira prima]|uniref:Glucose-6-phosphate dehydrogenase n=1 Tax=Candidatus Haliotispira prima TaxID=3034016 RepID=A0ABY8MH59_9SPIO|nr:glucose-6-phosphate dehydrogenase [Candidatus Haliotispira prima]